MPAFAKVAILSAISSLLATLSWMFFFRRVVHIDTSFELSRLDAMSPADAAAYIAAHTMHPSTWETITALASSRWFWLQVLELTAWLFVFVFASSLLSIRLSRNGR